MSPTTPNQGLLNPPKFANGGPSTPNEWANFWRWIHRLWIAVQGAGNLSGTAAQMAGYSASDYPGAAFYQTDRNVTYQSVGGNWVYVSGEMRGADQALADLPQKLGANDAGFRYQNSYFRRTWEWDGGAWHYADAGFPAGAQVATASKTQPPSGGLWQPCDGTLVACALDNATVVPLRSSNTQPDANGNSPAIQGGEGGEQQAAEPATLATEVGVANPAATGSGQANLGVPSVLVSAGTGSLTAGGNLHTHTDAGHTHTIAAPTVTQPVLNAPSEQQGGLPLRVSMAWWMRR